MMCWCTPNRRTPFCGSSRCRPDLMNGDPSKFTIGSLQTAPVGAKCWAGWPPGSVMAPVDTRSFIRTESNIPVGWGERDAKI